MLKGFTLVELLVAIVIITILAAIGIPQFANALARARAGEVSVNLNQIRTAQEAYKIEVKKYKDNCTWGHGTATQIESGKNLGVIIPSSKFFKYTSLNTNNGLGFNASAILTKSLGSAEIDSKVTLNEKAEAYPEGSAESKASMTLYLRTFINCDTPSN